MGSMEFLVQAAFYGERSNTRVQSYLGSSIPEAALQIIGSQQFQILVLLEPAETVASIRFLRTYTKKAAYFLWSFNSKRFANQQYAPTHPLTLDRHSTRIKANKKDKSSLASLVIRIIVARKFTLGDRERAFELLEHTRVFSKVASTTWRSKKSIGDALDTLEFATPKSGLLLPLRLLAELDVLEAGATEVGISALYNKKLRDNLLKMYSTCIAPIMKKCNASTIEKYHKVNVS
ncbi:hypothetical protein BX666DRAFT_659699 [Dichotomocladium elegans]|nr:hypothetical protein BX666DRAFT_659699 [Dichotomocladium elegans]